VLVQACLSFNFDHHAKAESNNDTILNCSTTKLESLSTTKVQQRTPNLNMIPKGIKMLGKYNLRPLVNKKTLLSSLQGTATKIISEISGISEISEISEPNVKSSILSGPPEIPEIQNSKLRNLRNLRNDFGSG
jgi:hypothetical protein